MYIQRSIKPPKGNYFLLGPRGTGKSTWLQHNYSHATRIDFLLGEEKRRFNSYPERIRNVCDALQEGEKYRGFSVISIEEFLLNIILENPLDPIDRDSLSGSVPLLLHIEF